MHCRRRVIDNIGIAAVKIHRQSAIQAHYHPGGRARYAGHGPGGTFLVQPDTCDIFRFAIGDAIDVGVVGQHVARGGRPRDAVGHAARLGRHPYVIDTHRCVVSSMNGDGNRRGRPINARDIPHFIGKDFGEGIGSESQGFYKGITVVDDVRSIAV